MGPVPELGCGGGGGGHMDKTGFTIRCCLSRQRRFNHLAHYDSGNSGDALVKPKKPVTGGDNLDENPLLKKLR